MRFLATTVVASLLAFMGIASPVTPADFETAPTCPIGPNWRGEPLPIGCKTGLTFGNDKVGTGATSSDSGVVRAEFDASRNAIRILTVGYGTAEVCLQHQPIRVLVPSRGEALTGEYEDVTQSESCASYSVAPELAMNCRATEVNESGFEVTTNHIHQGCVIHQGWAPPEDASVPKVTAAWSSDPAILRVSPQNGTVRVEALASGRATYCYERDGRAPQLGTGPFCWSLVVHPRTVNLAGLTRQQAEPVCNYSQSDSVAYVQMGCRGRINTPSRDTVSSSAPSVIALDVVGWTAARTGQSRVCFIDGSADRCVEFTVFGPNQDLPNKPATQQTTPQGSQPSDAPTGAEEVPGAEVTEIRAPAVPEFTVQSRRNIALRASKVGDRLQVLIKTDLPARSKVRIITSNPPADSTDGRRLVRTFTLNKKGDKRVFLPLADRGTVRLVAASGKGLGRISW